MSDRRRAILALAAGTCWAVTGCTTTGDITAVALSTGAATDSATGPVVTGPLALTARALLPSFDGCLSA